MTDLAIILIAIAGFGAGVVVTLIATMSRINDESGSSDTPLADEYLATRYRAAIEAAEREGIERLDLSKITKE